MPEERHELDPEVRAAIRETQREHAARTHRQLAGTLISEHLQRTVGARLRDETDPQRARSDQRTFRIVLFLLLGTLALFILSILMFIGR